MSVEPKTRTGEIDFTLPFFPARLTALYHVPSWHLLEKHHRVRYTQLYALYLKIEQTAFFEELLATTLLPALYGRPDVIGADLAESLRSFEEEERRHSGWFREMNHRIDPERFSLEPGNYVFIPSSPRAQRYREVVCGQAFYISLLDLAHPSPGRTLDPHRTGMPQRRRPRTEFPRTPPQAHGRRGRSLPLGHPTHRPRLAAHGDVET